MNSLSTGNKEWVLAYFQALSGRSKSEDLLDRYITDPELKHHIRTVETAFPFYELIPHQIVADSDLVAARCTFRGVHKGEFAGIQPTGKPVSVDFMIFYRIHDGRVAEHWMQMCIGDLLNQLTG